MALTQLSREELLNDTVSLRPWVRTDIPTLITSANDPGIWKSVRDSIKVLENAGYIHEGTFKDAVFKNGMFLDQVLYAKVNFGRAD